VTKSKKKICIISPCHWAACFGGSEYQLQLLLEILAARGSFDITYLARNVNPSFSSPEYSIICVSCEYRIRRYSFLFDVRNLLSTLRKIRPEVILQRVGCAYTGIVAYYARCNSCKTIWHVAIDTDVCPSLGKFSLNYIFRFLDKKALEYGINHVHYIIAQTEHQGDLLQQHYGRRPNVIIPNFHPFPQEVVEKGNEITVVWVANLKPLKQPEVFVRMARDLRGMRGVKFIMIGRALNTQWHREMLKKMSALENLEYLGECSLDEVNKILAKAHIFVNTSTYEGFPNTYIQAWMRKVPVVSLNVNPDNIINHNRIGFFSKTYNQMVKDVARLIQDSKLRHDMGERAQTFAFDNFSMKNAEKIIHMLEQ
jgi:glycosyltransferase involved in cell wall biosynthesis